MIQTRNPVTHQKHRREVFWQITFPILLGGTLLLSVCGLTIWAAAGGGDIAIWRDISLIWIIAPSMVLMLIILAILGGSAYGVIMLIRQLPSIFWRLQRALVRISGGVRRFSDGLVAPFVRSKTASAAMQSVFKK